VDPVFSQGRTAFMEIARTIWYANYLVSQGATNRELLNRPNPRLRSPCYWTHTN